VVDRLSGGQRARASLAAALVGKPEVLVLDEPTVGLDPALRRDLWGTFADLAGEGATVLVSSHVMDEARRCEELLLLREGLLLASGTVDAILRRNRRERSGRGVLAAGRGEGGLLSTRIAIATALRVLSQLRRDLRTVALLLLVPCVLVTLLKYLFVDRPIVFDRIGGPLLGLFPFIAMFLVTSITMLRERTTGTLERLMTLPLAKLDLLLGYGAAFALVAAVQALVVSVVAFGALDLHVAGPEWIVIVLAVGNAVLGMALGLFLSAFARTEFQAVQFMPAFVFPQLLLCGLFVPREDMARFLEVTGSFLPLNYAYDALDRVTRWDALDGRLAVDAAVIVAATLLALALGAATLRRRTP